jgi:hypothetical protein
VEDKGVLAVDDFFHLDAGCLLINVHMLTSNQAILGPAGETQVFIKSQFVHRHTPRFRLL